MRIRGFITKNSHMYEFFLHFAVIICALSNIVNAVYEVNQNPHFEYMAQPINMFLRDYPSAPPPYHCHVQQYHDPNSYPNHQFSAPGFTAMHCADGRTVSVYKIIQFTDGIIVLGLPNQDGISPILYASNNVMPQAFSYAPPYLHYLQPFYQQQFVHGPPAYSSPMEYQHPAPEHRPYHRQRHQRNHFQRPPPRPQQVRTRNVKKSSSSDFTSSETSVLDQLPNSSSQSEQSSLDNNGKPDDSIFIHFSDDEAEKTVVQEGEKTEMKEETTPDAPVIEIVEPKKARKERKKEKPATKTENSQQPDKPLALSRKEKEKLRKDKQKRLKLKELNEAAVKRNEELRRKKEEEMELRRAALEALQLEEEREETFVAPAPSEKHDELINAKVGDGYDVNAKKPTFKNDETTKTATTTIENNNTIKHEHKEKAESSTNFSKSELLSTDDEQDDEGEVDQEEEQGWIADIPMLFYKYEEPIPSRILPLNRQIQMLSELKGNILDTIEDEEEKKWIAGGVKHYNRFILFMYSQEHLIDDSLHIIDSFSTLIDDMIKTLREKQDSRKQKADSKYTVYIPELKLYVDKRSMRNIVQMKVKRMSDLLDKYCDFAIGIKKVAEARWRLIIENFPYEMSENIAQLYGKQMLLAIKYEELKKRVDYFKPYVH